MKKSKFWIAGLCAMLMVFCGCGNGDEESGTSLLETTEMMTEETTEETTPAPTEPLTRDVSELKVGMIFYGEESDHSLLTTSLYQEMAEAAAAIDMTEDQIVVQYNSREAEWTQIEESILDCVDQGCQLILGCAREYEAVIAAIAEEYPEIMFACVGSELYNGTNSGTFTMDVGAAQYLCGAVAGLQTTTDRVGFVAAKNSDDVAVTNAVNAFAYGVWSTNPEAIVDVAVIGKWFLPGAESYGIDYLESLGCDTMGSYTDCSVGDLQYQWQQYFSMKLNQIIQKEVIGEAWCGDYYGGAVTCELTIDLPEYVWEQMAQWGTMTDVLPEETAEETSEETLEETAEETAEETEPVTETETVMETEMTDETETVVETETMEEITEPYVIPEIEINGDTGYLANVRVHEIDWDEE